MKAFSKYMRNMIGVFLKIVHSVHPSIKKLSRNVSAFVLKKIYHLRCIAFEPQMSLVKFNGIFHRYDDTPKLGFKSIKNLQRLSKTTFTESSII